MFWKRTVWCVVLMVFLSMLAGCSGEPDGRTGQDTPQAVMSKSTTALLDGDKQAFVECFTRPERCRAYAGSAYDAMRASTVLSDALKQKHGDKAWDTFVWAARDIVHELMLKGFQGTLYFHPLIWEEADFLQKLRYEERDGAIWVNYSGVGPVTWPMVREKDVYSFDPTKVLTPKGLVNVTAGNKGVAEACERTLKMLQANEDTDFADLVRAYTACLFELQAERSK